MLENIKGFTRVNRERPGPDVSKDYPDAVDGFSYPGYSHGNYIDPWDADFVGDSGEASDLLGVDKKIIVCDSCFSTMFSTDLETSMIRDSDECPYCYIGGYLREASPAEAELFLKRGY